MRFAAALGLASSAVIALYASHLHMPFIWWCSGACAGLAMMCFFVHVTQEQ